MTLFPCITQRQRQQTSRGALQWTLYQWQGQKGTTLKLKQGQWRHPKMTNPTAGRLQVYGCSSAQHLALISCIIITFRIVKYCDIFVKLRICIWGALIFFLLLFPAVWNRRSNKIKSLETNDNCLTESKKIPAPPSPACATATAARLLTQVEQAPSPDFLTFMGLNWIPLGV